MHLVIILFKCRSSQLRETISRLQGLCFFRSRGLEGHDTRHAQMIIPVKSAELKKAQDSCDENSALYVIAVS